MTVTALRVAWVYTGQPNILKIKRIVLDEVREIAFVGNSSVYAKSEIKHRNRLLVF